MVMNWLGARKPDHPLADEKSAKEVFATLSRNDAEAAIEEIRHWIELVMATEGFRIDRRAELLLMLEEAAQAHQRKLSRDYLSSPRPSKFREVQLWRVLSGIWTDFAVAYSACIGEAAADSGSASRLKAQLPLLCVHALRALAAQLKWAYMHYEPGNAAVWESLGRVYQYAETRKFTRDTVALAPGASAASSAEGEFMKALMLGASSPDCLTPLDLELAERIVAHFSASFVISDVHQPQTTHNWIDLSRGEPPKRLTQMPPASPGLRFFAADVAIAQLDAMIRVLEGGAVPSDLNLGGTYEAARVLVVLRHLKAYWSATPPVRKHDRHEVQHKLSVVRGLGNVLARIRGDETQPQTESWETRNISAGGIAALVGSPQSDSSGIGELVGLSVEGGSSSCSVGMVRRCTRPAQQPAGIAIRIFARSSFAVALGGGDTPDALLLNDDRTLREEVLICMREGMFDKRTSPTITFEDHGYLLIPVEVSETGTDFEIARYRVMQQS